jgi:tRNA U34 5-carboxymethylaminomethyl modifying GTPase MnmE/TrmE
LINAETEMQRKQALSQMEGSLSKLYKEWRENIIKCLANVEAFIDFSEEENLEDNILSEGSFCLFVNC